MISTALIPLGTICRLVRAGELGPGIIVKVEGREEWLNGQIKYHVNDDFRDMTFIAPESELFPISDLPPQPGPISVTITSVSWPPAPGVEGPIVHRIEARKKFVTATFYTNIGRFEGALVLPIEQTPGMGQTLEVTVVNRDRGGQLNA